MDLLKLTAPMTWRGTIYPVSARRATFRHNGVEHVIQYRDYERIEQLGAHGLTFSYTIPLRQNIARERYQNAFTVSMPQLFRDMLDRTPGTLFDPILNKTFTCVPRLYDDTTDVLKRDGTDAQIELRHSPPLNEEDPALADIPTLAGVTSSTRLLDDEVARADWRQEPAPEPSIDALQAADGVLSQGMAQIGKASAALHDFAFKMEKLEATCERAENPQNWGILDAARRNREAATRLNQRLTENPATKLRRMTTRSLMLLADLAREVGMTLEELLRLNPTLARLPYVPAGAIVTVRAAQPRAA